MRRPLLPLFAIPLVLASLPLAGCKRDGAATPPETPAARTASAPAPFAERGAVLASIESGRFEDAEATLRDAPDTADVHFLKAKLALARQDAALAYRLLKEAIEREPDWAEYHYELGLVAPLPLDGLSIGEAKSRFEEGGKALAKAVALAPREPKYLYARAYWLSMAPADAGGSAVKGKALFDEIAEKHPHSVAADRVRFDRAAGSEDWALALQHAQSAGGKDAAEGARLCLQLAGSLLHAGKVENTREALEAAAKLHPPAAGGFCDAGFALDGGGNDRLADPFWSRCLELDPEGPKAAMAKARIEARTLKGPVRVE